MTTNGPVRWTCRIMWLGILANLSFAIPALAAPDALTKTLGLGGLPEPAALWLRNAGMLLVALCIGYALAVGDPLNRRPFVTWAIGVRFLAVSFWVWQAYMWEIPLLWWFAGADGLVGLLLAIAWMRANSLAPPPRQRPWRPSRIARVYAWFVQKLERLGIPWYRLHIPLIGSIATGGLRRALRAKNLHTMPNDVPDPEHPVPPWNPEYRDNRSPDGSYNDLEEPAMGMAHMRFGRNMPLPDVRPVVPPAGDPAANIPSPVAVSRELLARPVVNGQPQFVPATTLNLLAAAWIQFQNHGWFNHKIPKPPIDPKTGQPATTGHGFDPADYVEIPLDPVQDKEWIAFANSQTMRLRKTVGDPTRLPTAGYPPTFRNTESHWWDASQIYGAELSIQQPLRTYRDGLLHVEGTGVATMLPSDPAPYLVNPKTGQPGLDLTGFNDNYWLGMTLLHTLFVREHNELCVQLKARYQTELDTLSTTEADQWLFNKARLIVAGLMAKIHTIEWTPGILGHPALRIDMDANWWGILGRWAKVHLGRLSNSEAISGIIGSPAEHHAAPYSLTEDFVAVYRLHPLMPDLIDIFNVEQKARTGSMPFADMQGVFTRAAAQQHGLTNWMYSFGKQHPGAITLRNYPHSLRHFERSSGQKLDLATIDVFRDRERGVPSYNRFRELLRMRRMDSYQDLVGHRPDATDLIATLERLYGKDGIDRVDLIVGLFAEKVPPGYGFSDTAFRIFILMASRRLKSDRFFTEDFRPEVYTPFGIDWLNRETMRSLLVRHYPALAASIPEDRNTFAPWN